MVHYIELFGNGAVQETLQVVYDAVSPRFGGDLASHETEICAVYLLYELVALLRTNVELVPRLYHDRVVAAIVYLDSLHASLGRIFVEDEYVLFPLFFRTPSSGKEHRYIQRLEEAEGNFTFEKIEKGLILLSVVVAKTYSGSHLFLKFHHGVQQDGNSVFVEKDHLLHRHKDHLNAGRLRKLHILHRYEPGCTAAVEKPLRRKECYFLLFDYRSHSTPVISSNLSITGIENSGLNDMKELAPASSIAGRLSS